MNAVIVKSEGRTFPFPPCYRALRAGAALFSARGRRERPGGKQSLGEKPAQEQNLFAFREVCSRGKWASAGGRRVSTQLSHAGPAGPWLLGASRREPGLRGPQGPEDPAEGKCEHWTPGTRNIRPPPPIPSSPSGQVLLSRAFGLFSGLKMSFSAFRLSGRHLRLRFCCVVNPAVLPPPGLPASPASHPSLITAREPRQTHTPRVWGALNPGLSRVELPKPRGSVGVLPGPSGQRVPHALLCFPRGPGVMGHGRKGVPRCRVKQGLMEGTWPPWK